MRAPSQAVSSTPVACVLDHKRHTRAFLCDEIGGLGFVTRACADTGDLAALLDMRPDVVVSRIAGDARDAVDLLNLLHVRRFRGDILLVGAEEIMSTAQNCGQQLALAMLAPLGTPYRAIDLHDRLHKFLSARPARAPRGATLDIVDGLRQGNFDLWYQGKVDARRLEIRGVDATLVWRHAAEAGGTRRFWPGREHQTHLAELSAFVLNRTARDFGSFLDDGGRAGFAINVPVFGVPERQLADLADALVTNLPAMPTLLLQVRGRDLVTHLTEIGDSLSAIRRSTIGISIEDFEISHVPRGLFDDLPIFEIKVDQAGLPDHGNDRRKHARCSRILDLARRYGLRTVATGIDSPSAFSLARDAGFDQVQGPLFGGPVAHDKFARSLLPRRSVSP